MREKMKGIPLLAKTSLARDSEPRLNSQLGPVDMDVKKIITLLLVLYMQSYNIAIPKCTFSRLLNGR